MFLWVLFSFIFLMNVSAFTLFAVDKYWSMTGHRRISERALLVMAVLSGAYGAWAGMLLFRHKTQHQRFTMLVPVCFILWMVVLVILCMKF